jgi:Tol biopolymer transport system component
MNRRWIVCVLFAIAVLVAAAGARPQGGYDLYQQALSKERTEGKLAEAIALYDRVVREFAGDRALAAKALLRLGECHEKLGDTESRKAYERLVRDFADQKEVAEQARARLAALAPGSRARDGGTSYRKLWTAPEDATLEAVSPDGRYLGYVNWSEDGNRSAIMVHDLTTGTDRRLTKDEDASPEGSAFSRDSKQCAFAWSDNTSRRAELRVASLSGTGIPEARRIVAGGDLLYIYPYDWTPDGKLIAVLIQRGDASSEAGVVSVADGSIRTLRSGLRGFGTHMAFSPDGRYLAFDLAGQDSKARDIAVVATGDGREVSSLVHRADDALIGWSPDGSRLVFTSDRAGTRGLWAQPIADGKLAQVPELIRSDVGQSDFLGIGLSGNLYSESDNNSLGSEVWIGSFDAAAGQWASRPADAQPEYFPDLDFTLPYQPSPDWSPDGKSFAVVAGRDVQMRYLAAPNVLVRSLEAGTARVLRAKLATFLGPVLWAPDGSALVGGGRGLDGRRGIFRIDAKTGETSPLAPGGDGGTTISFFLGWSPDGKRIHFTRSSTPRGQFVMEKDLTTGIERELLVGWTSDFAGVSPDGLKLYYRKPAPADGKGVAAGSVLVERDLTTGSERPLIRRTLVESAMVRLSPDGRFIAAVGSDDTSSGQAVILIPVAGGQARDVMRIERPSVPDGRSAANRPELQLFWSGWAPDSQSIFVKKRPGGSAAPETWWVPVDERKPRRLDTGTAGEVAYLRWHADGHRMALVLRNPTPFKPYELWVLENVLLSPKAPAAAAAPAKK